MQGYGVRIINDPACSLQTTPFLKYIKFLHCQSFFVLVLGRPNFSGEWRLAKIANREAHDSQKRGAGIAQNSAARSQQLSP